MTLPNGIKLGRDVPREEEIHTYRNKVDPLWGGTSRGPKR
jgi:hypothetical protein